MRVRSALSPRRPVVQPLLLGLAVAAAVAGAERWLAAAAPSPGRAAGWRQAQLPLEGAATPAWARLVVAASAGTAAVAAVPHAGDGRGGLWVVELPPGGPLGHPRTVAVDLDGTGVEVGGGLAVDGRTVAVGAPAADDGAGVVWLVRDASESGDWSSLGATRVPSPRSPSATGFGQAVALSGRTAVVGAPVDSTVGHAVGSLWVVRDTSPAGDWSAVEVRALWPGGVNLDDRLGAAVALAGRSLAVGMPLKDIFAPSGGAAYLLRDLSPDGSFGRSATVRLRPAGVGFYEGLGRSVAVSGRTAAVGGRGAVWVLRDSSAEGDWSEVDQWRVGPPEVGSSFGAAVATNGAVVLVGEPDSNRYGTLSGAVWAVEPAVGDEPPRVVEVSPLGVGPFDRVGHSLAMGGDAAVVGGWVHRAPGEGPTGGAWLLLPGLFTADFEGGATVGWGSTSEPTPTPTAKPRRRRR